MKLFEYTQMHTSLQTRDVCSSKHTYLYFLHFHNKHSSLQVSRKLIKHEQLTQFLQTHRNKAKKFDKY